MTALEILMAARAKMAGEGKYACGSFAYTAGGDNAHPCDDDATCWSAFGAVWSVSGRPWGKAAATLLRAFGGKPGRRHGRKAADHAHAVECDAAVEPEDGSDVDMQGPALAAFDRAIASLEVAS